MLWRTFKPPQTSVPTTPIHVCCYNCGSNAHFGNDCPTRMPGKPIRSSTWSLQGTGQTNGQIQHPLGHSIKGRASKQEAAQDAVSEEEDPAKFFRPRIPEPRRGQIRIAGDRIGRGGHTSWNHNNRLPERPQPRRDSRYSPPPSQPPPSRRSDDYWRAGFSREGRRQRSLSPRSRYPQRADTRSERERWQPPLPPEPVPYSRTRPAGSRRGDYYEPMPSAAKNAWSKHRT